MATPAHDTPAGRDDWNWEALRRRSRLEALRILGNYEDAEEAAQEALMRAWRLRLQCRGVPGPWVAQIARNEALRLRGRRRRWDAVAELDETHEGAVAPPDDALVARIAVRDALATLTAEERRLVELRYELDLAQPDIALALGISEGTIRVRLHRIRKRLRERMASVA